MIMSDVEDPASRGTVSDSENQSIAELIKQVSEESSRLLRGELRLAQAEMTEKAKTAGVGIGAFGVAAVLGWFALGIAALLGKRKVAEATPPVPTETVESVKKDVEEIKESVRR
jgi:hypothetical protein